MVHAGPARPRKWRGTDLFRSKSVDLEWIWVLPLGAGRLERPNGHIEQERPARASVAMPRLVSPLTRDAGTKFCAKSFTKGLSSDDSRCSQGRPQAAAAREAFLYMPGAPNVSSAAGKNYRSNQRYLAHLSRHLSQERFTILYATMTGFYDFVIHYHSYIVHRGRRLCVHLI